MWAGEEGLVFARSMKEVSMVEKIARKAERPDVYAAGEVVWGRRARGRREMMRALRVLWMDRVAVLIWAERRGGGDD